MKTWLGLVLACLVWPAMASAQVVVHTVTITTDSSGDSTVYTPSTYGEVLAIRYVPHATTPLDTGADITITDNITGLGLLTVTNINVSARDFLPRAYIVNSTGTAALYAAGGANVHDTMPVAGAIKVVTAGGGATKVGTLYIYVQGR